MTTRNPNGLVRVTSLCIGSLIILNGTGCAWRLSTPAPATVTGTASVAAPSAATSPTTGIRAPASPQASAPPIPRNSESTPGSAPTGTPLTQASKSSDGVAGPPSETAIVPPKVDHRKHAGNYRCDHGRTIRIADVPDQTDVILLSWQGSQHRLQRVHSHSGAERFEALATGLVWIVIPGKAMLLSTNQGRPLANECHP